MKNKSQRIDTGRKDDLGRPIYNWIKDNNKTVNPEISHNAENDFQNDINDNILYENYGIGYFLKSKNNIYHQSLEWDNCSPQEKEDILTYYYSPNGYSEILRKGQQENYTGAFHGDGCYHPNINDFKNLIDNHKTELLQNNNNYNSNDDNNYDYNHQQEFYNNEENRRSKNNNKEEYRNYAEYSASQLTMEQKVALSWYCSDGSFIINKYLNSDDSVENITNNKNKTIPLYNEDNINDTIDTISDSIQNNSHQEPVIVYRGLNKDILQSYLNGEELNSDNIEKVFQVGETISFQGFSSASTDPTIASSFASSQVVLELKTNSTIPTGGVSSWGEKEQEMIIDKDTTFKIVNTTIVDYDYPKNDKKESLEQLLFKTKQPKSHKQLVIQLEQLD